jgi:multisubunit Na+/H+ antiporter MnhE subunit
MEKRVSWLYTGALLFPVLFAGVIAEIIFLSGEPESSQVWLYPGLVIGVCIGATCLYLLPYRAKWQRLLSIIVYFPLMLSLAWVAGFTIFFWNSEFCC